MSLLLRSLKFAAVALLVAVGTLDAATPLKILIATGQSSQYHDWTKTTPLVKKYLEETGLFTVDVAVTPAKGEDMSSYAPKWSDYAAVVLIYEGADFSEPTKAAFVEYMKNGGGLVSIHDSDNAFPKWEEFNEMIGVGGWGGRTQAAGPKIRWTDGKMVLDSTTPGNAMHPPPHDFLVTTRTPDHPIMKGLPAAWMHANDEEYSQLRGPAKNVTVLATAITEKRAPAPVAPGEPVAKKGPPTPSGTGENEPMLMAINYGKGRVFHTTLGHVSPRSVPPFLPLTCVGFIVTVQRGTEWAATGNVTQKVPADFPTAEKTSNRN